jgi:hypothetical protein
MPNLILIHCGGDGDTSIEIIDRDLFYRRLNDKYYVCDFATEDAIQKDSFFMEHFVGIILIDGEIVRPALPKKTYMPMSVSPVESLLAPCSPKINIHNLIPEYTDIPPEFLDATNSLNDIAWKWYDRGLPAGTQLVPNEGIDLTQATRHIVTILRATSIEQNHKIAGVAYLMSLWFKTIKIPEV